MTILTDAFLLVIVSSIRTNRARCAFYKKILDLLDGKSVSVEVNEKFCRVRLNFFVLKHIYHIYYITSPLTIHFPITRTVRYQPIFHTLYFTLYCAWVLNTVPSLKWLKNCVEEFVNIQYGINKQNITLVIVKYGVISLIVYICTRLCRVKILTLLVK